jgi:hypothetical protein
MKIMREEIYPSRSFELYTRTTNSLHLKTETPILERAWVTLGCKAMYYKIILYIKCGF